MKVLKFGGSSVGSSRSLSNVRSIVSKQEGPVVVVVSALGGVTDQLLELSRIACTGDKSYESGFAALKERHAQLAAELLEPSQAEALAAEHEPLFGQLSDLLKGVCLLKMLSRETSDEIVSFGERLSSRLVARLLDGAVLFDSLELMRTVRRGKIDQPDLQTTNSLLQSTLKGFDVAVMGGFIARDLETGYITNLGRGGSDYTASIVASALDAEVLEIWTDVDGFMTADPRMIDTSYVIGQLGYKEAMELCNFGAKVIYPPTLYPVRMKNIPIRVKNTFNPDAPGTIITNEPTPGSRPVTGVTSIGNTCIITLSGTSMVDILGVDGRIFSTLADNSISAFLVCQSSSETGISIGVKETDAELARTLLEKEFATEISVGAIDPVRIDRGLATVAVVGENMKNNPGVAGKLFSVLGRNNINVVALAQGADETNLSLVVDSHNLRKAVAVIHDAFFLSEFQELNLFICGVGTVGGQLLEQLAHQREKLMSDRRLKLNIIGIARSTKALFDPAGIDLATWKDRLSSEGQPCNPQELASKIISMNLFNSVFVDVTTNADVASIYKQLFEAGVNVVTANKLAASSEYSNYSQLKQTAMDCNVKWLYETNVGASLPIINTIHDLVGSGDNIERIEAVLSGTLNFIFNTVSEEITLSRAVQMAKEQGYSEPDPRIDLSGKDVIRKLVILAREAGYKVNQEDVQAELFIPAELFECSEEEFWQKLPSLDEDFEKERKRMESERKHWRFVASMENGTYKVSLREFSEDHSFYQLDGSNNIITLTTERYHQHPMLIQGYGAGASVTAAGVFADIMRIANV